ncbi:MAG: hypothetical protein KatS3mg005_3323 [Bryobacteraceae bacterium]|nr:MAG: hypothetical protein KatS3mg005_3323 [Bryobacteraceae bacterium]
MAGRRAALRIGTSGWSYRHWRGVLYPLEAKSAELLGLYARVFRTVELNASFYRMQRAETYGRQAASVPDGFVFAVKAHRSITHEKRLEGVETIWREFVSSAQALGGKLGPVLLQFPPSFRCRPDLLRSFLEEHRRAFGEAVRLAFEFRHASWFDAEALDLLRGAGAAAVIADSSRYPRAPLEWAGPFVYLRFHGPGALFASGYSDEELQEWALRIREWLADGRDVYVYFNNDAGACAVRNALQLMELAEGCSAESSGA